MFTLTVYGLPYCACNSCCNATPPHALRNYVRGGNYVNTYWPGSW